MTDDERPTTNDSLLAKHREEAWPVLSHSLSVIRHPSSVICPRTRALGRNEEQSR